MKNQTHSPNLSLNAEAAQEPASNPQTKRPPTPQPKKKSTRARQQRHRASRDTSDRRWQRIKGRLAAKVGPLDNENLKAALLVCGITAGALLSVVVAIKLMPVATVIVAVLGLAIALRLWEQLRYVPS